MSEATYVRRGLVEFRRRFEVQDTKRPDRSDGSNVGDRSWTELTDFARTEGS